MNKRGALDIDRLTPKPSSHRGGWIVSYADMMTIILTFFILLLSISTIAQTKYDLLVQAFTGERAGNLQEVKEDIDKIIEEQHLEGEITTTLDKDGLAIEFSSALLFLSGQADMRPEADAVFRPIEAHLVEDLEPLYGLVIEGYTDDVPITNATYRSNWDLASARAIHVRERLERAGLDPKRMSVKGYANTRPATDVDIWDAASLAALSPDDLERARAANRRVIVRIDALDPELARRLRLIAPSEQTPLPAGSPRGEPDSEKRAAPDLGPFDLPSSPP